MPDACQDSHWSANFEVTSMTRPRKISTEKAEIKFFTWQNYAWRLECHFYLWKAKPRLQQSDLMWQLSPGLVVTVQTVSQYTACVMNFHPAQKCWISEVQRLPCGIAVLGSQMWDDSMQCRMVDRSTHMFQKAKQTTTTKPTTTKTTKKENNPNNKTRNVKSKKC